MNVTLLVQTYDCRSLTARVTDCSPIFTLSSKHTSNTFIILYTTFYLKGHFLLHCSKFITSQVYLLAPIPSIHSTYLTKLSKLFAATVTHLFTQLKIFVKTLLPCWLFCLLYCPCRLKIYSFEALSTPEAKTCSVTSTYCSPRIHLCQEWLQPHTNKTSICIKSPYCAGKHVSCNYLDCLWIFLLWWVLRPDPSRCWDCQELQQSVQTLPVAMDWLSRGLQKLCRCWRTAEAILRLLL